MTDNTDEAPQRFNLLDLLRVALWGIAAAGALTFTAFTASSDAGTDRVLFALAQIQAGPAPAKKEAELVGEALRVLAADRDRLQTRIAALERNLEDVTGSIARIPDNIPSVPPVQAPAASPEPGPQVTVPTTIPLPRPATAPQAPADPSVTKTEFGIDLGGANAVEGLRSLWAAVQARHGALLHGMRPVMAVRESTRPSGFELRLVAGPIPNAAAAARLCANLVAAGIACQPAVYDGQRLALR
jgi:hypothetical protein